MSAQDDGGPATDQQLTTEQAWNPLTDSGDCAEMCAALGIDTVWRSGGVLCSFDDLDIDATEYWESHHGDRAAAWRLAAVRVASEIGRAM